MALKINVTWPVDLGQVCIPIDSSEMAIIATNKAIQLGGHITINNAFGADNRVCDEDRYRIGDQRIGPLERCQPNAIYGKTLIILLESPHKYEYHNKCIDRPKGPAQKTTGNNIRDHLVNITSSCYHIHSRLGQDVRVILANPIQFQCSLVSVVRSPKWQKTRDAVWRALWDIQEIREEFRMRLRGYFPDFIINACTHDGGCKPKCIGGDPQCRKRKLHDFLNCNFPFAHIYTAAHPASGHWKGKGLTLVQEGYPSLPGS